MLVGMDDAQKKKMALTEAQDYYYLNQVRLDLVPGDSRELQGKETGRSTFKDDVEDFNRLRSAFEVLSFKPVEQVVLLGGVRWLTVMR